MRSTWVPGITNLGLSSSSTTMRPGSWSCVITRTARETVSLRVTVATRTAISLALMTPILRKANQQSILAHHYGRYARSRPLCAFDRSLLCALYSNGVSASIDARWIHRRRTGTGPRKFRHGGSSLSIEPPQETAAWRLVGTLSSFHVVSAHLLLPRPCRASQVAALDCETPPGMHHRGPSRCGVVIRRRAGGAAFRIDRENVNDRSS